MRTSFTQYINNSIWIWELESWYFLTIIIILVLIIAALFFAKYQIDKKIFKSKKDLTYKIDEVIYELAKFQKENPNSKANLNVIKSLFSQWNPNYLEHYKIIKSEIEKISNECWVDILPEDMLNSIKKDFSNLKIKKILQKFVEILTILFVIFLILIIVLTLK